MKRGKLPLICTAVLALALIVSSCASPEVQLATTLNLNIGSEPATLDPGLVTDGTSASLARDLFLGLTNLHTETYEVIPHLATDWEVSEDGLVWTFYLRDDVHWVHYDPQTQAAEKKRKVTAHDVEYGVKRVINPVTGSGYAYVDYVIKNAYAVNTGDESVSLDSVGVVALDDHTVQFTLEHAAGYFPNIAGMWSNFPLPREAIEEFDFRWTEPGNLWTCGPFMLDTWEHDNRIVLVKNPHYHDAQNVAIETVNFAMVEASSTVFQMYQAGELDTSGIPLADRDWVRADPQLSKELHVEPSLTTYYMMFNVTKPPVDNSLVRKALAAAFDKQAMVEDVRRDDSIPAKCFAPPGVFGSPAEDPNFQGIPFDPEQARQWLAEAGYPDGQGFPELVLTYAANPGSKMLVEFVQQQWKEHLGIEMKALGQEFRVFLQTIREDPPHVWGTGWFADYPDENNFVLEVCHPIRGQNWARWGTEDPAAQRFMGVTEAAAKESDPQKRKALYFEAEKILCEDQAIMIPMWFSVSMFLTKPYVERKYNPLGAGLAGWRVRAH
jgi:oligopeptide transport system substrate-binding protein